MYTLEYKRHSDENGIGFTEKFLGAKSNKIVIYKYEGTKYIQVVLIYCLDVL